MSSTDVVASEITDIESGLQELINRGYQFVHPRDKHGEVLAVVGVRVHDNVVDVVRLNAEDDVTATRMPGTEEDIFEPSKWLWRSRGEAAAVLTELLALPDERTPGALLTPAEARVKGRWVSGATGNSKWLAAG
ncbi:hypothetical protein [Amycolatopsis sp. H20-H5]|uniref:hypothetical protein n=1 Tax=Amycolatopsis sp. H20-H5 TaxID=3046309 RepID=UPI002DBE6844|nr:hypothetical protein [Amycolatopsis sp. H20-H5]MEC3977035.1 hypothetical protein [Amycolatopsis sp. H20-H5]